MTWSSRAPAARRAVVRWRTSAAATAGAISLIQRNCPFVQKLANAEDAGAAGVILFNEGDTPDRTNALFRSGSRGPGHPRGALELRGRQRALPGHSGGENPTVSMTIDAQVNDRFFPQVLAETQGGSPNRVVGSGRPPGLGRRGPGRQRRRLRDVGTARDREADRREEPRCRIRRSASCGSAARRRA